MPSRLESGTALITAIRAIRRASAAAGAVAGSFLTHPFDTLKSRAQAHAIDSGQSAASLWRGVMPRCALSFSTMFVGSFAFRAAKQHLFFD